MNVGLHRTCRIKNPFIPQLSITGIKFTNYGNVNSFPLGWYGFPTKYQTALTESEVSAMWNVFKHKLWLNKEGYETRWVRTHTELLNFSTESATSIFEYRMINNAMISPYPPKHYHQVFSQPIKSLSSTKIGLCPTHLNALDLNTDLPTEICVGENGINKISEGINS